MENANKKILKPYLVYIFTKINGNIVPIIYKIENCIAEIDAKNTAISKLTDEAIKNFISCVCVDAGQVAIQNS